jgi:hypothetical protein
VDRRKRSQAHTEYHDAPPVSELAEGYDAAIEIATFIHLGFRQFSHLLLGPRSDLMPEFFAWLSQTAASASSVEL